MAADVEAYAPFRAFGAVLEVVRFPYGTPIQELLLDAMRHLAARYDARLVSLNGHIPDHVFRIKILEEKCPPVPTPITFQELWGSGYDVRADRIDVFAYSERGLSVKAHDGLGRALLDPPYGLRKGLGARLGTPAYPDLDRAWMRDCVHRFCSDVLELPDLRDTAHLTIHEWSTDWSNFFDAGREWWGTFCWTIEDPLRKWTTAILASSTD
ncbi:MAG: hypothetical protein R3B07_02340 [Polyangiaceae bacterium]